MIKKELNQSVFLAAIHDFQIASVLNKGIVIFENIRISNQKERVRNLITEPFFESIGGLEAEFLISNPYMYLQTNYENDEIFKDNEEGMAFLNYYLIVSQIFCSCLWLVKDNSVNVESGFLNVTSGIKTLTHSNLRSSIFYNSVGKRSNVVFTQEEIKKALEIHNGLFNPITYEGTKSVGFSSFEVYKEGRIERFFYFLQAARNESYLPSRIAGFVTLLETLLSTSSSEVTHKLKERLAWLLGSNFEERKEIFDNLGIIYTIRSANVHGNTMPKKGNSIEKLEKLSIIIEDYTRKLIIKFIGNTEIMKLYKEKGEVADRRIEALLNDLVLGKQI